MMFLPRHIESRLLAALKTSPVVFLNGARQTGKSTLVNDVAQNIGRNHLPASYVTFDRPTVMAGASAAPEAFLTGYPKPLIIDEVQLVPEVLRALKVIVDEDRLFNKGAVGNYLLTGSAGGYDDGVIDLNQQAYDQLRCEKEMVIVPGATHLFEEPRTLEAVATRAAGWFAEHLPVKPV